MLDSDGESIFSRVTKKDFWDHLAILVTLYSDASCSGEESIFSDASSESEEVPKVPDFQNLEI